MTFLRTTPWLHDVILRGGNMPECQELILLGVLHNSLMRGVDCYNNHVVTDEDSKRHADFFSGLTPQQEYDLHTKRRKEMDDE